MNIGPTLPKYFFGRIRIRLPFRMPDRDEYSTLGKCFVRCQLSRGNSAISVNSCCQMTVQQTQISSGLDGNWQSAFTKTLRCARRWNRKIILAIGVCLLIDGSEQVSYPAEAIVDRSLQSATDNRQTPPVSVTIGEKSNGISCNTTTEGW